jgi:hypothetical protein
LANKQYISIIRLLQHSDIDVDGEINVQRVKKQLTAEFNFSPSAIIEIDNFSYNKTDVLDELDTINFAERMAFHKAIWDSKNILSFLEENQFSYANFNKEILAFFNNPEFDAFISPYFAVSFNIVARNYINTLQFEQLGYLLSFEDFINGADREEAFRSVRIFIDENIRLLKNTSKDNFMTMRPKIAHWITSDWSIFVNNLPDDFYETKEDLVIPLINLTVAIQRSNFHDCKSISFQLNQIEEISSNLKETIANNHNIYSGEKSNSDNSSGFDYSNFKWIIWVIIIGLKIVAMGGC